MKIIYISGKITGLPIEEAKAKFAVAEELLKKEGHHVINPLRVCPYNPNFNWHDYMIEDIKHLFSCNAIYMLADWEESKGAKIEVAIAKEMQMEVIYQLPVTERF